MAKNGKEQKNFDREGNEKNLAMFIEGRVKTMRERYCKLVGEVTDGISFFWIEGKASYSMRLEKIIYLYTV